MSTFPSPLAGAIANAEGFNNGSAGTALNNPGDLMTNGVLNHYSTLSEGWAALEAQIGKWLNGSSAYANQNTTLQRLGQTYTGNDNAAGWSASVAQSLGLDPSATIGQAAGLQTPDGLGLNMGTPQEQSQAQAQLGGPGKWPGSGHVLPSIAQWLLSQQFVMGFIGAGLILVGALGFDKTQTIVTNVAKKAAESTAV